MTQALERENRELKRANKMLSKAPPSFAVYATLEWVDLFNHRRL